MHSIVAAPLAPVRFRQRILLGLVLLLSVVTTALHAQSNRTLPPATVTPANTLACANESASPRWSTGAVFVDTTNLVSRYRQIVAASWCVYLASGSFEPYAYLAQWTDSQIEEGLTLDAGIEWARNNSAIINNARIRFRVDQIDSGRVDRFLVTSTVERADSSGWKTNAVHRIQATVSKDTARFEAPFASTLKTALRYVVGPMEFIRIDGGVIDTIRAKQAAAFVLDVRRRLALSGPPGENIKYLFTKSGNGRALLGFSQFDAGLYGFTGRRPVPFVFADVPAAGESYWHELVHAALAVRKPVLDESLEESLSKALGGTEHRTWPQFVCEDRSFVLDYVSAKDVPGFFAKPEDDLKTASMREWEYAFLIDYLAFKSGDSALRTLINGNYDFSSRSAARASIASILGITPVEVVRQVSEYNSDLALQQRCATKK